MISLTTQIVKLGDTCCRLVVAVKYEQVMRFISSSNNKAAWLSIYNPKLLVISLAKFSKQPSKVWLFANLIYAREWRKKKKRNRIQNFCSISKINLPLSFTQIVFQLKSWQLKLAFGYSLSSYFLWEYFFSDSSSVSFRVKLNAKLLMHVGNKLPKESNRSETEL